jgi:hypothetical protein
MTQPLRNPLNHLSNYTFLTIFLITHYRKKMDSDGRTLYIIDEKWTVMDILYTLFTKKG